MLNEITTSVSVTNVNDSVYSLAVETVMEVWYPFAHTGEGHEFEVADVPVLRDRGSNTVLTAAVVSNQWRFAEPNAPVSNAFVQVIARQIFTGLPIISGRPVQVDADFSNVRLLRDDGQLVDQMPSNLVVSIPDIAMPVLGQGREERLGSEVIDPRINHDLLSWVVTISNTLMAVNSNTLAVADQLLLTDPIQCWSPGPTVTGLVEREASWLSYIPTGDAWQSLNLFSNEGMWLMNRLRDPSTNVQEALVWQRGMMNPNSLYTAAVAAVFVDCPVKRIPEPLASNPVLDHLLEWSVANRIAENLRLRRLSGEQFFHRSDWAAAAAEAMANANADSVSDNYEVNSVIANTVKLMNPWQQMWLIVSASELRVAGGLPIQDQTTISLVWWDPASTDGTFHVHKVPLVHFLPDGRM